MKKKPHGNAKNKYAVKENPKTARLVVRCTPEQLAARTKKAEAAGMKLPAWILQKTE